jgi:acyl-CoA thioesterase-2
MGSAGFLQMGTKMVSAVKRLLSILDLEQLEHNLFRGRSPQDGWQRVFGGQVIGQALVAASRTVEDRVAHSLHAYFMRPGDPSVPIIYEVDRIRDGRSFNTRRVVAIQHGHAIFSMSASFHLDEPGFEHQSEMPDVPGPDELPSLNEIKDQFMDSMPDNIRAYFKRERPIEIRPVNTDRFFKQETREPKQSIWFRATDNLPDDAGMHQCALAYASDFSLLDTALIAHGRLLFDPRLMLASLDHAMWFHRPVRADGWLLYTMDSPVARGARGFCRGTIFTPVGVLVASVAQECMIRERRDK